MKSFFFTIFLLISFLANAMNLFEKNLNNSEEFFKDWEYISDNVMGGVSEGKAEILDQDNNYFLRLTGNVSTKNNGGFIQVRSSKDILKDNFTGIKLKVKGKPSEYYVHIRTNFLYYHGNITQENFLLMMNGNM